MELTGFARRRPDAYLSHVIPRLSTNLTAAERVVATFLATEVNGNNARGETSCENMTPFHALEAPSIDVPDYVKRIAQYAFSSPGCLLAAFHYVKRTVQVKPELALTSLSVHRLLITAVVLAAKYFDDITYSMGYYAKVGGLPVKELAFLELQMLSFLDFRLHISPADFHTLEQDMIFALQFVPRSPLATDAQENLRSAGISGKRTWFFEAMHDDDDLGLWQPHPTPDKSMLISMEQESSPCRTPRASSPCSIDEYCMSPRELYNHSDEDDFDASDSDEHCVQYSGLPEKYSSKSASNFNEQNVQFSGELQKFLSTSTVNSDRSGSSPGCTPKRTTNIEPSLFHNSRPYPDSFPRPVPCSTRGATALEVYPNSPPTPERSSYDTSWGAQVLFEQQVREALYG